jgi:hypothetical protein
MKPHLQRLGGAIFWGLVSSSVVNAQTSDSARACTASQWSAPRVLAQFDVTSASLAAGQDGEVFILGRGPYLETDTSLYVNDPFVAFRIGPDGKPTRLPAPLFAGDFANPRGGVVNGTLHVFWGEADSTATLPTPRAQYAHHVLAARGIWTSSYAEDRWSPPKFVGRFFNTNWLLAKGWARADWSSAINLAVVGIPATHWTIRWLNAMGSSTVPDLDLGVPPLYTTLMSPAPSQVVLGYIANDPSVPNDQNSVFAIRSTNDGRSWSTPVRIALSGQHQARDLTMVQSPNGQLHAIWSRNTSGEIFGGQMIGYSVSRDSGQSWSTPEYWNPGATLRNPRAVSDSENTIHLVYQTSLPDGWPTLTYTSRSVGSSAWAAPRPAFSDTLSARMPELTRATSGDVLLFFAQRRSKAGRLGRFESAISYLRTRRPCMPSQ